MRITDKITFQSTQRQIETNKRNLDRATVAVSTGKKLVNLQDDPGVLNLSLRNDRDEANLDQYEKSLQHLGDRYRNYESLFTESYNVLSQLKARMVSVSNATDNPDDAVGELLKEAYQVREHLLSIANTEQDGQHIFSGSKTDTVAFDGNGVYTGNEQQMTTEVLPSVKMETNITGDTVFGGEGFEDGVNVFNVLGDLIDDLESGLKGRVTEYLDEMDQAIQQVTEATVTVGTSLNRIELSQNTLASLETSLAQRRQDNEDVDAVEAITEYRAHEYALQASLQVNARLLSTSLMDYLG